MLATACALTVAPAASARDGQITSFDGTRIELSYFPAAGLAPGAKAPTVLFGPGWSSGRTTDETARPTSPTAWSASARCAAPGSTC